MAKTAFKPRYSITNAIAKDLLRIESTKEQIKHLPINPHVLASLRETMRLKTTHYSTMIEGNTLNPIEIAQVIKQNKKHVGKKREDTEVKGYYRALHYIEQLAARKKNITEKQVQTIHALVMSGGKRVVKPSPYRTEQNVIRESITKHIVYLPPESKDVPRLMKNLVLWINHNKHIPVPLVAGIAHYQFATIHPYFDGNGRTARLLTTLILHLGGYDLKGLYSLEAYYAQRLNDYYQALSIGPSNNYYMGRVDSDITPWLSYFIKGMADSFERVSAHMRQEQLRGAPDQELFLHTLDPQKRAALELLSSTKTITARQISDLFGFKPRTSAYLCKKWVNEGFLEIENPSNKTRSYKLADTYRQKLLR